MVAKMWVLERESQLQVLPLQLRTFSQFFTESQFSHLQNGDNTTYSPVVCGGLSGIMCCAVFGCSVVSDSVRPHGLQSARLLCPWGFSRQEYWSGLPCPPPGDLPNPGTEPRSPALWVDSLPSKPPTKKAPCGIIHVRNLTQHPVAISAIYGRLSNASFYPCNLKVRLEFQDCMNVNN